MAKSPSPESRIEKKRREWPRVRLGTNNGKAGWHCDARIEGKGKRYFFTTATDADAKADALRIERDNNGLVGMAFPEDLRLEALRAHEALKAVGATITEAVAYFLKHAKPAGGKQTVSAVVKEFIKTKEEAGRRPDYISVQGYVLGNVFGKVFGERQIHEITHSEIGRWMGGQTWAVRTRRNYHRDLSTLFEFAIRRNYCASNPLKVLDMPKALKKRPGVLTVDEASGLLEAAGAGDGLMLAAIAIGLFCGVRSGELERLDWQHVRLDLGTITITAEASKLSEERVISMPENLRRWLKPIAKESGPVAPSLFAFRLARCAKAAKIAKYPKNALRHSFASYHYAHHESLEKVTSALGHYGSARTFINSYRGLVQPSEAAKFWALAP